MRKASDRASCGKLKSDVSFIGPSRESLLERIFYRSGISPVVGGRGDRAVVVGEASTSSTSLPITW